MNVYLLFALAFGALTGVADVRMPRSAVVSIRVRSECRAAIASRRSQVARSEKRSDLRPATRNALVSLPLTGATSPRAPAVTC